MTANPSDIYSLLEIEVRKRLEPHRDAERDYSLLVYWYGAALMMCHELELTLRGVLTGYFAANRAALSPRDTKIARRLDRLMLGSLIDEVETRGLLPAMLIQRVATANDKRRRLVHEFFVEKMAEVLAGPAHWNAITQECRALVIEIRSMVKELVPLCAARFSKLPISREMFDEVVARLDITSTNPDPTGSQ